MDAGVRRRLRQLPPPVNTRTTEKLLNRKPNGNPEITLNWITRTRNGASTPPSDNLLMLTPSRGGPIIWLSEHDAAKAGIVDNDWVEVFNANARRPPRGGQPGSRTAW